jgi:hypothetical protein
MKKNALLIVTIFLLSALSAGYTFAQETLDTSPSKQLPPLFGNVQENEYNKNNVVTKGKPSGFIKDSLTGNPVAGAQVSIPDRGVSTFTKADGSFKLDTSMQKGNFILSVKKDGYLPFALNASTNDFSQPFTLHVEKAQGQLIIDNNIHHLGDNNFSELSANAGNFRLPAEGAYYTKEFYIESLPQKGMTLRIGSLMGLDTIAALQAGQSNLGSTYSSPLLVYVNSVKVAEIAMNGNNKVIPIPKTVLKPHTKNLLVLQTGVNQTLSPVDPIDYDDMEFMNIILEEGK